MSSFVNSSTLTHFAALISFSCNFRTGSGSFASSMHVQNTSECPALARFLLFDCRCRMEARDRNVVRTPVSSNTSRIAAFSIDSRMFAWPPGSFQTLYFAAGPVFSWTTRTLLSESRTTSAATPRKWDGPDGRLFGTPSGSHKLKIRPVLFRARWNLNPSLTAMGIRFACRTSSSKKTPLCPRRRQTSHDSLIRLSNSASEISDGSGLTVTLEYESMVCGSVWPVGEADPEARAENQEASSLARGAEAMCVSRLGTRPGFAFHASSAAPFPPTLASRGKEGSPPSPRKRGRVFLGVRAGRIHSHGLGGGGGGCGRCRCCV
mmetsp:Transcript_31350/g.76476  ORF Transcript_31350/g.76476 Transcript_31350/m.76476 type:complete len:320 (+) Transcript_31350:514-1473(+)